MSEKFNVLGRFEYNDEHFNVNKENTFELSAAMISKLNEIDDKAELPTVVNNKFLHTNASTGALEWTDVSGGAEVFIADYGVTTYQELMNAHMAGKILYLRTSSSTVGIYRRYVLPLDVDCSQDATPNMKLIFRAHFINYDAGNAANNSLRLHEFSMGSDDGTSMVWSYRRGDIAITAVPVV